MSHFQLEIIHIFISFSVLNGAKNGHKIFSSIISTLDAFARKRVLSQLVTIGRSIWVLKAFSIVLSRSSKYVILNYRVNYETFIFTVPTPWQLHKIYLRWNTDISETISSKERQLHDNRETDFLKHGIV